MEVPNGSPILKMVSLHHSYCRNWFVGWSVDLAKWAKIAISELIWLKVGMEVLNGPWFEKMVGQGYLDYAQCLQMENMGS